MKITLDLTELVGRGALTAEEAEKLKRLAAEDTGSLGANILLAFGTVAVTLGLGALIPSVFTAVALGLVLFIIGLSLWLTSGKRWWLFAQICMTVGALATWGGLSYLSDGSLAVNILLTLGLAAAAGVARSGLLAVLAVLALTAVLGGSTAYWHATYSVSIWQPTLTILVLAVLSIALLLVSSNVAPAYERVCLIGARAAVLLINLAFLIGTLWGDYPFQNPAFGSLGGTYVTPTTFTIVWAVLLIGVGIWAVRVNRRWVVNTAAIFGAIHFYTQWFSYQGLSPFSILAGGLLLIAFGFALRWINQKWSSPAPKRPAAT